jgi:hypothetical protein
MGLRAWSAAHSTIVTLQFSLLWQPNGSPQDESSRSAKGIVLCGGYQTKRRKLKRRAVTSKLFSVAFCLELGYNGTIWAVAHRLARLVWKSRTTTFAISSKPWTAIPNQEIPRQQNNSGAP